MRFLYFLLVVLLLSSTQSFAISKDSESEIFQVARAKYQQAAARSLPTLSVDAMSAMAADEETNDLLKNLSLQELLEKVVTRNHKIQIQQADLGIKLAEEEKTHSIFEPEFVASIELEDSSQKNTVEEFINRNNEIIYSERNWDYALSINGFAPSGAKYNLGYNLRNLSNSVTKDLTDEDNEYQMYFGFSLTQPLLKNYGVETTKAGIHAAEAETDAAFHDYRQEMMQTVNKAANAYWTYFQAQEKLKLRQESIRIANKVLVDNRERYRTGKMAETEVFEAMAGVASRKSLLSEANQEHLTAANGLRSILAIEAATEPLQVVAVDVAIAKPPTFNKDSILQRAFELQPNYLATQAKLKQADIKLVFAKNQRLPELDLKASYGLNGLDFDHSGSWEQIRETEFDSWSVGLEFRMPLLGGIDSKAELKKVQLEKRSQLLALKDIEIKLSNDIDTEINKVLSAVEQKNYADEIVGIQKKLLNAELARLQSGKSNSRLVLEKEDDHRNALEIALKNKVKLQTALISLELSEGSILLNHGLEIMERLP